MLVQQQPAFTLLLLMRLDAWMLHWMPASDSASKGPASLAAAKSVLAAVAVLDWQC